LVELCPRTGKTKNRVRTLGRLHSGHPNGRPFCVPNVEVVMSALEAVAVVLILVLAAAVVLPRPSGDSGEAAVGAVVRLAGSEFRCTTTGPLAAMLALVLLGVVAVVLLTR
jgi:hypothetical protein